MTTTKTPAVEIEMGGKTRTLRLTFAAMREIRESASLDMIAGTGTVDPYVFPEILAALMRHDDREITAEEVAHMMDLSNLDAIGAAVTKALTVAGAEVKEVAPAPAKRAKRPRR